MRDRDERRSSAATVSMETKIQYCSRRHVCWQEMLARMVKDIGLLLVVNADLDSA